MTLRYTAGIVWVRGHLSSRKHLAKCITTWVLVLLTSAIGSAQLTIKVSSTPDNTPDNATLYAAGTFNNWNPADPARQLTALGNGKYTITLNPAPGVVEFKFTRGNWETSEANTLGMFQPNHQVTYNGQPKTIEVVVLSWADMFGGGGGPGLNGPNGGVHIIDNDFYVPELARSRRIWIYLPPDYGTNPNKHYPVLYMQDGQNLFDSATSLNGQEWDIDGSMDQLFEEGDPGCIVVGIDNGGVHRVDEYSPWANPAFGGGEGVDYVHFIVNHLKPHVDANYRTLPDRNHTGIMGSSMGGLISMYALIEYQNVFSKAGVFSPAFWFADDKVIQHIQNAGKVSDVRVFFLAGGQEPTYVANDVEEVVETMLSVGFSLDEIHLATPSDGEHMEWFWAREYPIAYEWLFKFDQAVGGGAVSSDEAILESTTLQVYPNPATDWVRLKGDALDQEINLQIIGTDGRTWKNTTQQGQQAIWTGDLPRGAYFVHVHRVHGRTETLRLIHE
jgi:predicted alpha/beta superfamily hydrolase